MKMRKANWILMAVVAGVVGLSMGGTHAAKASPGYYQTYSMLQDLKTQRENCFADCNNLHFTATTWRHGSTTTVKTQLNGSILSGGGTAHVRGHAGCKKSNSDILIKMSNYSSGDEAQSATCPATHGTVTAWDCEIELADGCGG